MTLMELSELADEIKPILEVIAFALGATAVFKWLQERSDRASDVLLSLEDQFEQKCGKGRELVENDQLYDGLKQRLRTAASDHVRVSRVRDASGLEQQTDLDNLLRFYVVLYAIRRQRQIQDRALSICYRFWLAHYYRKDRAELRAYIDALFPTLRNWLRADMTWGRRLWQRPFSAWWRSFFTPTHFWKADRLIGPADRAA